MDALAIWMTIYLDNGGIIIIAWSLFISIFYQIA